ncbi:TPA: hypothetical protein OUC02_004694 [Escherichia coli]|nr:hypothetical protein [Escherichia coli]
MESITALALGQNKESTARKKQSENRSHPLQALNGGRSKGATAQLFGLNAAVDKLWKTDM